MKLQKKKRRPSNKPVYKKKLNFVFLIQRLVPTKFFFVFFALLIKIKIYFLNKYRKKKPTKIRYILNYLKKKLR
jgi:hypothetical protein